MLMGHDYVIVDYCFNSKLSSNFVKLYENNQGTGAI